MLRDFRNKISQSDAQIISLYDELRTKDSISKYNKITLENKRGAIDLHGFTIYLVIFILN
jgi:hypothetical protein